MAIYDLVGVEFPKSDPLFAGCKIILKRVTRIEYLIEIRQDLLECIQALNALKILLENEHSLTKTLGYDGFYAICNGATAHAVLLYSKAFNSNERGRNIDKTKALRGASDLQESAHNFFIDFRNKHFAHAEWKLNEHKLYILPGINNNPPRVAPDSQVARTLLCKSYHWEHLAQVAQVIVGNLASEIETNSEKLLLNLSEKQVEKINSFRRC